MKKKKKMKNLMKNKPDNTNLGYLALHRTPSDTNGNKGMK